MKIAGQPTRMSAFIDKRVNQLKGRRSQKDIAQIAGYKNQNMITMIKQGEAKLALDKVPGLARALEVDPAMLFRLALEQFFEDTTLVAVNEIFGTIVSKNEAEILAYIRAISTDEDPQLTDALKGCLETTLKK